MFHLVRNILVVTRPLRSHRDDYQEEERFFYPAMEIGENVTLSLLDLTGTRRCLEERIGFVVGKTVTWEVENNQYRVLAVVLDNCADGAGRRSHECPHDDVKCAAEDISGRTVSDGRGLLVSARSLFSLSSIISQ
jgi:hypothetical protein